MSPVALSVVPDPIEDFGCDCASCEDQRENGVVPLAGNGLTPAQRLTLWKHHQKYVTEQAAKIAKQMQDQVDVSALDVTNIAVTKAQRPIFGVFGSPEGITLGPFGDGGTGKTILMLALALSAATGEAVLPEPVEPPKAPMRVLWLDYERRTRPNRRRLDMLARGASLTLPEGRFFMYEPVNNLDTDEGLAEVLEIIGACRPDVLFLDSGSFLSGADPKDKEAPDVLARANRAVGLPMIVSLHTPKDDRDPTKPYGSNFWPAVALETHSAISVGGIQEQTDEDGGLTFQMTPHTVVIRNRKNNDDEPSLPWAVTIHWPARQEDGSYAADATIRFSAADAGASVRAYRQKVASEVGARGGRKRIDYGYLTPYVMDVVKHAEALYGKAEVRRDVEAVLTATDNARLVPSNDGWAEVWKQLDEAGLLVVERMTVRRPARG